MDSGLVSLRMKDTMKGNWLALGGTQGRPQMSKHQNKKVCLIHLALPISEPLGGLWCKVASSLLGFLQCLSTMVLLPWISYDYDK